MSPPSFSCYITRHMMCGHSRDVGHKYWDTGTWVHNPDTCVPKYPLVSELLVPGICIVQAPLHIPSYPCSSMCGACSLPTTTGLYT